MHKTHDELLTAAEACAELGGIDRSTLTRWVQTGRITPARKLPGRTGAYLFDPTEVQRVKAIATTAA